MNSRILAIFLAAGLVGTIPVPGHAYLFSIDSFSVTKNDTVIFQDDFDDGNPPPSAPDFSNGNAANYFLRGTMGPEVDGKLVLDSADASLGTNVFGDPFLFQSAILSTSTDSSNLISGLKSDDTLAIEAVFDLAAPTIPLESYGINFTDRATGMGLPGDDIVGLRVIQTTGGPRVQFFEASFVGGGSFSVIDAVDLESSYDQIILQLARLDTDTSGVTASFAYVDGATIGSWQSLTGSADIFNGEAWTRAQFLARTPVPIPPAFWLFGFGLLGLIAVARRRQ